MRRVKRLLGNHLTRLCFECQLTDEALASRAGISRAQLNRIRNGRAIPRVKTAIAIAAAMRCRVRDAFFLLSEVSVRRQTRDRPYGPSEVDGEARGGDANARQTTAPGSPKHPARRR